MKRQSYAFWTLTACTLLVLLATATPAAAQRDFEPLFDKFNVRVEASWLGLSSEIRLDSELLGTGTTLNFESDLNLDANKAIPTIAFEWQIARKHRLGVRWQDITRDSTSQALTDIQFGEETIPVDAAIGLGFDTTQVFIDYAYYPWVKEKWAAGFGIGLRWLDLSANLAWALEGGQEGQVGTENVDAAAPVPYIYFEYRRLFGEHWRLIAGLGWLEVTIEDISGGQYIGRVSGEYLLGKRWGFGAAVNLATIDVDWAGIDNEAGESVLTAQIKQSINDISIFARVRF